MTYKVFIDGSEGTTGLHLRERLAARADIALLNIEAELHRDADRRRELMQQADVIFLCLPDEAAIQAAELCADSRAIVIDASTAHRVDPAWVYGLPELSDERRAAIAASRRIANPGCYATGAICLLYPLISRGLLPADYPVAINGVSGYSGGGKKMIAQYEQDPAEELSYPRNYALTLSHKHIPEIQKISGLTTPPIFCPQVGNYYAGMTVSVPLFPALLPGYPKKDDILAALRKHYASSEFISVKALPADGFINAGENTGSNRLSIYVCGHDEAVLLVSVLDNLGKGASGAAMQNMNIALGIDEGAYLR